MTDELSILALEIIEVEKRIREDTKKLKEIKAKLIEKSKSRNSSYTITVESGAVRMMKYKSTMSYKFNEKEFDKLDNEIKNNLLKENLLKVKYKLDTQKYSEAFEKNTVPVQLKELVEIKEKKPFSVAVLTNIKEKNNEANDSK